MPNKFSEYMSFGIPILTSLSGSVLEILNKEKLEYNTQVTLMICMIKFYISLIMSHC